MEVVDRGGEMTDWLPEQLKTIRNLTGVALLLIETNNRKWLPTILELLYEQCQQVIDENCVVRE